MAKTECTIQNCTKPQKLKSLGYCSAHEWHYRKYGDATIGQLETHGMRHTPLYTAWVNMRRRCDNPEYKNYKNWGGKGIKVCEPWNKSFKAFYNDMGKAWRVGLWLDRIDNSKGYSKDNCRWSTPREQQENRTNNRLIKFNGKEQTLTRWAEELGIKRSTLAQRYYGYKWSIENILTKGV